MYRQIYKCESRQQQCHSNILAGAPATKQSLLGLQKL